MRHSCVLFACCLVALLPAQYQEPGAGYAAVHQALLDASNTGVVLNLAAHPDDESSRTNAILRRKHGMRVVTLYSTFGDGGQNAIGREIGPQLAYLRVRETLRAAALSDVEVRWLGMADFGFSKTLAETLAVWGAETLQQRMRSELDALEPDIVLTNHTEDQGHGHHRATWWAMNQLLQERAAAGRRVPAFYARGKLDAADVVLDPAELEPARGETYARLAHRAWVQHVTQGPWGPHNPLQVGKDYWRLQNPATATLPPGSESLPPGDLRRWLFVREPQCQPLPSNNWPGDPAALQQAAREQLRRLRALQQQQAELSPAAVQHRIEVLQRLLLGLAGVRVEAWLQREQVAVDGEGSIQVVVHGVDQLSELQLSCAGSAGQLAPVRSESSMFEVVPTAPLDQAAAPPLQIPGRLVVGFPAAAAAGAASYGNILPAFAPLELRARLGETAIELRLPLAYTPVQPLEVAWEREVVMVPRGQTVERLFVATITSHLQRPAAEPIRLSMGPGIAAVPIPSRLELGAEQARARLLVRATIDAAELLADPGITVGFRDESARLQIQPVDVMVPTDLRVALVRGPDDSTERALADLGVPYAALDEDALAIARLEDFSTVLLDIRAYHHRPELAAIRDRLLQFASAGGRVVVMYHKPGEWNERSGKPLLAPFPLVVGNDRVTEEDAPVQVLQPQHRLWNHPHQIAAADFAGWVQERGLNFPSRWDVAWTPLLSLQDSCDEKPSEGALLYTQYGRGDFVYCSLALYRQLRIGHGGAARILVNLLAK